MTSTYFYINLLLFNVVFMLLERVCIKCEPTSHASHAVHWRIIETNTTKIENINMENINWTPTVVNKCLTLNST